MRTQDQKELLHILSSHGLSVNFEASIRFHPAREELPRLHAEIGPDYFNVIVAPVVRSEARKVVVIGSGKDGLPLILGDK